MTISPENLQAHFVDVRRVYTHTLSLDPMGPIPDGAIFAPLLEPLEGHAQRWTGQQWQHVPLWKLLPVSACGKFVDLGASQLPHEVPAEIPRYCGVIALKRHQLVSGELIELAADAPPAGSLYESVLAFYEAMEPSLDKDKMEAALFNVLHWMRDSPSVEAMRLVLGLTTEQVDALFVWAKAYEAAI